MDEKPTYEELERRVQQFQKSESELKMTEKNLRKREERYRSLIDSSPLPFLITQEEKIVFVNPAVLGFFGVKNENEIIGTSPKAWTHPDFMEWAFQRRCQALEKNEALEPVELTLVRKDGHEIAVLANTVCIRHNGMSAILSMFQNITERKRADENLKKSEARHGKMLANIGDVIVIIDQNGINRYKSPNIEKLFGWKPEEVVGASTWDNVHPDDIEPARIFFEKIMHKPDVIGTMECRYRCKDGSYKWIEFTGINLFHDPDIQGILGNYQDITERKQTEKALQESQNILNITGQMAKMGGWELYPETMKVTWTDETYRIHELPKTFNPPLEEAINFWHPEDQPILRKAIQKALDDGIPYDLELRFITAKGKNIYARTKCNPVLRNGKVVKLQGFFHDITDRKQAEEVLKLNYELLQIAGETAKFGGWSVDFEKNICTWSDAVADIHDVPHGYAPSVNEAINFYAPKWREKIAQCFSACAKDGIPYDEGMEIITQKGKRVWVRATGRAVKNEKNKIIKVQGSFQDITELKRSKEALKASEKKYQDLFENAQVALFRNRLSDGKILEINERYAKMAGYSTIEECMAEFNAADAWVDSKGRNELLRILQENGSVSDYETEIMRRDGTNIWISFSATISPEQGFLEGSIVEITERKRSEIEQKKLQIQLIQAQKMESVGRLAGGVAHDFNNMLGVILGHAELALEQTEENHDIYSDLKQIQMAAQRSADLTKQLLTFARKQIIEPKILNLNQTVKQMITMLQRLIGEDIDLLWKPCEALWPVKMDPSQIDQILANLCVNARDAITDVGKITIETDMVHFDEAYCNDHAGFIPGDFVLLGVSDNGSGMDKETLNNLFEPFFTTKEMGKGTGLGLAMIYGIVKQNSGFINVYSEPGQGSTFKIYLPRLVADEDTDMVVPEKKAAPGGNETILIVEDEPAILKLTRMMLERKGYSVLSAATPSEAIEMVGNYTNKIHLLMTDVVMPGMNGRDLARHLITLYPDMKLLFMSGYTANVIAHQGVLDDGVAFIQKPFSMMDLAEKIREVLDMAPDKDQG